MIGLTCQATRVAEAVDFSAASASRILGATKHLYKRVCPSVGTSVGPSVVGVAK